jgi:hypothetical protein
MRHTSVRSVVNNLYAHVSGESATTIAAALVSRATVYRVMAEADE